MPGKEFVLKDSFPGFCLLSKVFTPVSFCIDSLFSWNSDILEGVVGDVNYGVNIRAFLFLPNSDCGMSMVTAGNGLQQETEYNKRKRRSGKNETRFLLFFVSMPT